MAIYNIDNIRSINEDKSDIARYDAGAKMDAKATSINGHRLKSDGFSKSERRKKFRDFDDEIRKDAIVGTLGRIAVRRNPSNGRHYAPHKRTADYINNSVERKLKEPDDKQRQIDKARIERKLKESKAKQAKLKEAAQYILDVLDEQEYYDEYDNSNDYYYYE